MPEDDTPGPGYPQHCPRDILSYLVWPRLCPLGIAPAVTRESEVWRGKLGSARRGYGAGIKMYFTEPTLTKLSEFECLDRFICDSHSQSSLTQ